MVEDEDVKKLKEEFKRRAANRWQSDVRRLEKELPHTIDDINHYLATGELPADQRICEVIERMEYWLKMRAEAEAKRKARANRKRGRLTTNQKARIIK